MIWANHWPFCVLGDPAASEFHSTCVKTTLGRRLWSWRETPGRERSRGGPAKTTELEGSPSRHLNHQNHPNLAHRFCNYNHPLSAARLDGGNGREIGGEPGRLECLHLQGNEAERRHPEVHRVPGAVH